MLLFTFHIRLKIVSHDYHLSRESSLNHTLTDSIFQFAKKLQKPASLKLTAYIFHLSSKYTYFFWLKRLVSCFCEIELPAIVLSFYLCLVCRMIYYELLPNCDSFLV